MSDEKEKIELFDAYLRDELGNKELRDFEDRLMGDNKFKEEFRLYRESITEIKLEGFREEVKHIMESRPKKLRSIKMYWPIGVAATLILVSSLVYVTFFEKPDLYGKYFTPYPNILNTRSSENALVGIDAYSKGDYLLAIELLKTTPISDTTTFYLTQAYMSTGDFELALGELKKIKRTSIFYQQSMWYQALTYLRLDINTEARKILSEIKPGEFKFEESRALLKAL